MVNWKSGKESSFVEVYMIHAKDRLSRKKEKEMPQLHQYIESITPL